MDERKYDLKDTIKMMNSADYKERFIAEYMQLNIRMDKLQNMLDRWNRGELDFTPSCSYELLSYQLDAMGAYRDALIKRAEIEDIDLRNYT